MSAVAYYNRWPFCLPGALPRVGAKTLTILLDAQNPIHFGYMSVKEQFLQAIQRLPDKIDFRDVADEIALLAAVQEAERDIEQGRLISNEEMKSRIGQWSAK